MRFPNSTIKPSQFKVKSSKCLPLDCSWYMPASPRNPVREFEAMRLPGAKFFPLDAVKNPESPYPHMIPNVRDFLKYMNKLGIKRSDDLIVYDLGGNFSASRILWMFQVFGHPQVSLLDDFTTYKAEGGELDTAPIDATGADVVDISDVTDLDFYAPRDSVSMDTTMFTTYEQLHAYVRAARSDWQIIDARPRDRFNGTAPEPRPGLPSGHIPGALNLPFGECLDGGKFRSPAELKTLFAGIGVDGSKPIVVMCGSGVTACILRTALLIIGIDNISVFDGSWTEWAQRAPQGFIVPDPRAS
ncbi:hypothetical protein CANCADRAFT_147386 [Tortispora caseinolytica NRRL Y-17796]|uniref:Rhodanese domain-containing protein n=1 Tax=Tortispora caseinolytica NRRL Y-17796 TaxID=767744 RepID=A0A1E4TJ69_9ASCO|nr:hypothetical protein CANCADRAFT_147386 [Tortispora caseinolytica NRRL Y-17796]